MMYAYDQNLLYKAQITLAAMLDYAVNDVRMPLAQFYHLFLTSYVADRFATGDSRIVAGHSGVELVYEIMDAHGMGTDFPEPSYQLGKGREYWTGWSLAYYQWYSNQSFHRINQQVDIISIEDMYDKYHEMDIMQFVDAMDVRISAATGTTMLARLRMYAHLSQSELATLTGIPVRTIQQYEQRRKNISSASVDYVLRLSHALHCRPEDILEYNPVNM